MASGTRVCNRACLQYEGRHRKIQDDVSVAHVRAVRFSRSPGPAGTLRGVYIALLSVLLVALAPPPVPPWADDVDDVFRRAHQAPPMRDARLDAAAGRAAAADPGVDLRSLCRHAGVYEGVVLPVVVVAPDRPEVRASWTR